MGKLEIMKIELKPEEEKLRSDIEKHVQFLGRAFSQGRLGDDVRNAIFEAGELAHELHMLLKKRGVEPKHHAYMVKNREVAPDHPEFYMHFHPLEDLLKFLNDPHANDDPVDQTIGEQFEFRVYSRRWKHDDVYRIIRTSDGWEVHNLAINGPCDKSGRPFLFRNFDQDSISYPSEIPDRMEWLWKRAEDRGLTKEEVQHALKQLADWVSVTEKAAPTVGVWEGY